jgi:ribosomal protein S18 acetylase RimI-like enzyme
MAPRTSADLLRWGGDRLRVGSWRGDAHVAYIAPLPESGPPSTDAVRRCSALLRERGYNEAVTAALAASEANAFLAAGFTVRERLHLLAHELVAVADPQAVSPHVTMRRARRSDRAAALDVDARSFDPFWRLDPAGLDEAVDATPSSRFRVIDGPSGVVGYAVSGRAGARGFLQRLAVDPAARGRGYGSALVLDGLRWMKRRGAARAMVNTQERNNDALRLYERLGFRLQPGGLAVLHTVLA